VANPEKIAMPVKTMSDLFVNELRDVYHAEKQITRAIPKMMKAAQHQELKELLQTHLEETNGQIERLEQVFEDLGVNSRGKRCEAMEGLVAEAREVMEEVEDPQVRDAAMITAQQKVEHYEIAAYGSLVTMAKQLGHDEAAELLRQTLEEEKATDRKLTEVALNAVNLDAEGAQGAELDEDSEEDGEESGSGKARRSSAKGKSRG
jgi:ferritin-like metal-binding protein YciE